jgi:O-acetyl-ADP-ribose deacetylase (regulator of RNase III)
MAFEIIRNDITRVRADAIVNAANPHPVVGAGTDTAIHKAAGPELLEARRAIGDIAPGDSAETPAFGLKAKYVIHAVGPVWRGGNDHEPELLYGAYYRALELAKENSCASIGFPLISAGIFGYPLEKAWEVAVKACRDFLAAHPDYDIDIVFAVLDERIIKVGQGKL